MSQPPTPPAGPARPAGGSRHVGWLNVVAGVGLVLGVGAAGWTLAAISGARAIAIGQTQELVAAEHLLSVLKDLETGERGYALTGDASYLEPYQAASAAIPASLAELRRDNAAYDALASEVTAKQDFAVRVVAARRDQGLDAAMALVRTGQDKATMDSVRTTVATLQEQARGRIARSDQSEARREPLLIGAAVLSILAAFSAIALIASRRRRAERASRDLLGSVLDNAPVGLGFLDGGLRLRQVNQTLAAINDQIFGGRIGGSLWDMLPGERETLEPRLRAVLQGGRAVTGIEISGQTRDDRPRTHDYELGFFPLPSATGFGTDGAGLVVQDVTTRRRAERRLRDSEERYRTLIETSAAIVWTTPPEGMFEGAQTGWCAFTGQTAAQCEGLGWLDAVHPEDRDRVRTGWQEAVVTQALYADDYRLARADGDWRVMAARAVPILDEGEVREWVGTHTDITDRRRNEEELTAAKEAAEAANRAKSQFLANMSHELRTPLSAVIGYSEMLEEELADTGETALVEDVKKIQFNARHLLSLINDVLDLSKIEADRMTTYAEDFPVETLVREVSTTVETLVAQKGNSLVLDVAPDVGAMHSDQVKLRQCLFNLVSNAAKFTKNGCITLRAAREGTTIVLSVSDTGIGMTPEQLDKLFQRFSQADASTTRQFGGTGLGLAITRAFCRLLGGDVTVASTFGQGSVFTITVPDRLPEPEAEAGQEESAEPATSRHVVLVVDDDSAQRDLLTRFLEREGFDVRTAADGRTGIELARTLRPRAILLDVMMPQMDGWSVLTKLKADPDVAPIPVVMVTFVNEPGLGASLGAADTVLKPVEWSRLRTVMERFQGDAGDVLVVDDDADARARVRSVLERDGWTVTEAEDGRQALDRVMHAPPQLILLDLTMPLMDGFSFLHELRLRPGCADIPVVVLTARDLDAADRKRLDGADRVLSKGQTDLRQLSGELRALAPHAPHAESASPAGPG